MPAVSEGDKASHGSHQGSRQHANGLRNVRGDEAAANERLMRLVQVHTIKSAFIAPTKRIGNLTGIAETLRALTIVTINEIETETWNSRRRVYRRPSLTMTAADAGGSPRLPGRSPRPWPARRGTGSPGQEPTRSPGSPPTRRRSAPACSIMSTPRSATTATPRRSPGCCAGSTSGGPEPTASEPCSPAPPRIPAAAGAQ